MGNPTASSKRTTKFGKGNPGKPKGATNHTTRIAREAIARLVEDSTPQMQAWLDQIAEQEGPLKAWQCLTDVLEYHIPKLARHEHTGENGGAVKMELSAPWLESVATRRGLV